MKITIWGARGSTPVTGLEFSRYSGETACIEVSLRSGETILLDGGTGLSSFAAARKEHSGMAPVICLSHLHFDHVQGLPFYAPLYSRPVQIYGPEYENGPSFAENLKKLFDGVLFPVKWEDLTHLRATGITPDTGFKIGNAEIEVTSTNHPGGNLAWKIRGDGRTLLYTGDHEIPLDDEDPAARAIHQNLLNFMSDADLVIADAHFSPADHRAHKGWGHSDFLQWASEPAMNGRTLLFTHFAPHYSDSAIESLLQQSRIKAPHLNIEAARPGLQVDLQEPGTICRLPDRATYDICDFLLKISHLSDTYAILDALLAEGRELANADAGTIYLVDKGELLFAAAHNDSLFPSSQANKYAYMNARLPLDRSSIAGYVASTGQPMNISDAYALDPNLEYSFNNSFDAKTGYRTVSMLNVPLTNGQNRIIGVLQLINAKKGRKPGQFDDAIVSLISRLANLATLPLEKALLVRNMIMRMLQTSALRDPTETSAHVQRVGSVAAELYHAWAYSRDIAPEEILANKSRLRLAAMLHDIGKVGIPDGVLKKPGKLTDEERKIMQTHSALGASLFSGLNNELEQMARNIALHHHARWDGKGYTGSDRIPTLAGQDIPIWARIVAIADVYDALVSKRCYKSAWTAEDALDTLRKDAGTHFDPELVECFGSIQDIITTIYQKYNECEPA